MWRKRYLRDSLPAVEKLKAMSVVQLYVEQHERDKERAATEKRAYEVCGSHQPIAFINPHSGLQRREWATRVDKMHQESPLSKQHASYS